jgi:CheY-like chemotaxis protein
VTAELSKSPPHPPRILIVDDDPEQRSLMDSFLRSQNFETVLADPSERALELLPAGTFFDNL